ncbi:MAG: L-seryl-tRNA(Sec) selenium transferase [Alphaproteobacteria bacterium]
MNKSRSAIPSVDAVLRAPGAATLIEDHGRTALTDAVRQAVADLRHGLSDHSDTGEAAVLNAAGEILAGWASSSLTTVFNLTGTILHTNLGRAPLPPEAIEAMARVGGGASNLEYDLAAGRRGDRDVHLEARLCRLTGAEAATVVNNNAAAVLLCLNSLALRREALVSRGELIEIGGSFRIPDIMARAGAKLREVGTTNRTHTKDFAAALGTKTGLVMQVHTSNYTIQGFTAAVATKDLAVLAHDHGVPLFVDLGSGTLADLRTYGLPYEPTAQEALAAGADVVSFSGDKLLGGPQAGIMVGSADCIDRIRRNPMKRALRVDKMTIAALHTVLGFYGDPDSLVGRVPALRLLARSFADIQAQAQRLAPILGAKLDATVDVVDCVSQAGSGSLPDSEIPSAGLAIRPGGGKRAVKALAERFRRLPVPVIGRVRDGVLVLDLRCLEDEAGFTAQLDHLAGDGVP